MSDQWAIGIVRAPISAFLDASFVPPVQWIEPYGRLDFLADCFGIEEQGRRFILAERFSYRGSSKQHQRDLRAVRPGRGHITSIAIDENGEILNQVSAIDTGQHMSYPYTIQDGNVWYLVAEELSRDKVTLYVRESDDTWKPLTDLLPHAVVDPTVFKFRDRWWMFGTSADRPNTELRIWFADKLRGPWQRHPHQLVGGDIRSTRSGGTPFIFEGYLYRPTQNCMRTYGGSVVINRVHALTDDSFEERPIREILPPQSSRYRNGLHTLAAFGDWTLIDAKRNVLLPRVIAKNAMMKLMPRMRQAG